MKISTAQLKKIIAEEVKRARLVEGVGMNPGDLVRIVHAPDQPMWIRRLAGKVGMVVRNEGSGVNRVLEVMFEGTIHRLHLHEVEAV